MYPFSAPESPPDQRAAPGLATTRKFVPAPCVTVMPVRPVRSLMPVRMRRS